MTTIARRMWRLLEPIHDVVYFSPESAQAATELGLKGYWMGYFSFRAAPLGAVGPAVVTALFHGFHPARAERALPDAWAIASPEQVLRTRQDACATALRRIAGAAPDETPDGVTDAADLLWAAAARIDVAGRPLGAANAALPRPADPVAALWQAATTLREHRGDGHVAALVAHDVGPVEAHLLKLAGTPTGDAEFLRTSRRYSTDEWAAAAEGLERRGLLADATLTEQGRRLRDDVEAATDRAAAAPWRDATDVDAADIETLAALLEPVAAAVRASGVLPTGNPVGLD